MSCSGLVWYILSSSIALSLSITSSSSIYKRKSGQSCRLVIQECLVYLYPGRVCCHLCSRGERLSLFDTSFRVGCLVVWLINVCSAADWLNNRRSGEDEEATSSYRLLVQKSEFIPFIVWAIKCNVRNSIQKSGKDLPIIYWRGRSFEHIPGTRRQCSGFGGTGDCFTYNPQYDSGSAGRGSTLPCNQYKTTYTIPSALVSGGGCHW